MLHGELTGTRFCNERSIRAKLMCDSFQMKLISESKNIVQAYFKSADGAK